MYGKHNYHTTYCTWLFVSKHKLLSLLEGTFPPQWQLNRSRAVTTIQRRTPSAPSFVWGTCWTTLGRPSLIWQKRSDPLSAQNWLHSSGNYTQSDIFWHAWECEEGCTVIKDEPNLNKSLKGFRSTLYTCEYKQGPRHPSLVWPHGQVTPAFKVAKLLANSTNSNGISTISHLTRA